ncbi:MULTISPECIES: LPXTG cell wall anchor domain-containing protein [Streptomyces]|uniref:LPXTG cell wall anchor domain-containing protein n=1 Tax=Streptomyces TaxID=1883 RepID=UPI003D7866DE
MKFGLNRVAAAAGAAAVLCAGTGVAASPAAADEGGDKKRVLVVMLDFQDRAHADPGATKASFADRYFGAEDSLTSYYDQVSRGRIDYVPAVPEKVIGPFKLSMNGVGCKAIDIRKKTLELLEAKGLNRGEDYDSLSMALPGIGCRWVGLGTVGGHYTWMQAGTGYARLPTVVHEFGHNLGYPHQPGLLCKDGNLTDCVKGKGGKSPMSAFTAALGMTATQIIHSGWLDASEHQRVKSSGTFTLRPLYGEQNGVRALEVPLGKDKVVLEYRRPADGLDVGLGGVYAYRVTKGNYAKAQPIRVGSNDGDGAVTTLSDAAHKLKISVTSTEADGAKVSISLNGKAAPSAEESTRTLALMEPIEPTDPPAPATDAPIVDGDHEDHADGAVDGHEDAPADDADTPSGDAPGTTSEDGTHTMGSATDGTHLAETGGDATTNAVIVTGALGLLLLGGIALKATRRKRTHH